MVRDRVVLHGIIAVWLFLVCSASAAAQQNPVLDAPGFRQNRDYFSQLPFEHVDTMTGGLVLTFTDLVLPGNAGRDLRFQRTYNSKTGRWSFGLDGLALHISVPPRPTFTPGFQEMTPALEMSDGSMRRMAWYSTPNGSDPASFDVAISSVFWRYDRNAHAVSMPNGVTCTYAEVSPNWERIQACNDPFGNTLDFAWTSSAESLQLVVTQRLDASTSRNITLLLHPVSRHPQSITYDGRTWTYVIEGGTNNVLSATPPDGPGWTFTYDSVRLATVTTPHGGVISYTYYNRTYFVPEEPGTAYFTLVLQQRTTSGPEIQSGTWEWDYEIVDGISGATTMTTPSGRVVYEHSRWVDPEVTFDGWGGALALRSRSIQQDINGEWVELEREERSYGPVRVLSWGPYGTQELTSRAITRDGGASAQYVTEFTYDVLNFGDYHRPYRIRETGPAGVRETTRTFQHSVQSPYVVGLPLTERVEVAAAPAPNVFLKSWTYDAETGFRTSGTLYGVTTQFEKDAGGNVARATKANLKWTTYSYDQGQLKEIGTPAHVVTREINPDGTVKSETRNGRLTQFGYDDNGRLTSIQPAGANATIIDYGTVGQVRTTRGPSQVTTTLDGFGRPIRTLNLIDVQTNVAYDAEGRVIGEGYPTAAGGTVPWTLRELDALGRVRRLVNPDGTDSSRSYGPAGTVTIADENDHVTVQTWHAFGDPGEPRLAAVRDAENHLWSYGYNALGRLVSVGAEDGLARTWAFDDRDLLVAESHPESGTIAYGYDAAGVLASKTDANGTLTTYARDGNDRVEKITAGSRETWITYEPGSDNRQSATNGAIGTMWLYDAVGRPHLRQDAIDGALFTTRFEYDGNDALTALVFPSGRRVQYFRNAEGQPTRVFDVTANRDYATSITHHPSGGVASYVAGNGLTTTIEYDPQRHWVRRIAAGPPAGPLDLTYETYDGVGNPEVISDSRAGFDQAFDYDPLDRLVAAAGPSGPSSYAYDIHGNRSGPAYQYEPTTRRLASQDGIPFSYDNNGNTLTAGSFTYTYTPQNQVETATGGGVNVAYAYDADEQRVRKSSAGSTTYAIRGLQGDLLTEWKDPGTAAGRIRDYVYLGTRLLAGVARNSPLDPGGVNAPSSRSHRYATSWQVPSGSGGTVVLNTGVSAGARKSAHPDMPPAGVRIGVQAAGTVDSYTPGPAFPNTGALPKLAGVFLEFEVERYPFAADAEWLATDGGGAWSSGTDDLRLYMTSGGALVLKHDGSRTTPQTLWTSPPLGLRTPHTVELRFEHNVNSTFPAPNPAWEDLTSWVRVYLDDVLVATYGGGEGADWDSGESYPRGLDLTTGTTGLSSVKLKSPGAANGLLLNVWRVGHTAEGAHGTGLDYYGSTWRTTLLEAAGEGSYAEWAGGQPDWRARAAGGGSGGFMNPVTTNVAGKRISYRMESMVSRGITGKIGAVLVGVRMSNAVSPNTRAFVKRNGVETTLTNLVLQNHQFRWYRVAESGWLPTDTVEIGLTSGDNMTNSLHAVALLVEHNTPEPAPLIDTTVRAVTVNYTGNGGAQTVDFGGIDLVPTALFVMPVTGANGLKPLWWWNSRLGAGSFTESIASFGKVWPRRGEFHVVQSAGGSYNESGVDYVAIALFDPSGRYVIPFAASKPATEDNYTHYLRWPQTGALASTFTPDFVFGGAAFNASSDTVKASLYRGPGHGGDLTATLGLAQASAADRIQAVGAGTVQFGTTIGYGNGDMAFWAGRVSDGVSSARLMAVASYVGDGTASRAIPLTLGNEAPVFALVVPTNAAARIYRVSGDSTGRNTSSGSAVANSVTALAADQITVGTALNATGVTYDVWAITTGTVAPQ
jgi:YD repeat-containing protein